MGTRNLSMVQLDGNIRVAQYGQWDGYPDGLGVDTKAFVNYIMETPERMEIFKNQVSKCRFVTQEEYINLTKDTSDIELFSKYPQFSRDTGGKIYSLLFLNKDSEFILVNNVDFAKDGLFCEWAYLLNLDTNTLEVYAGFGKTPLDSTERFYDNGYVDENGYTPIRLVDKIDFHDLILMSDEDFVLRVDPDDEVK